MGQELVNSLNYAFECGELAISQRRGFITLIPKKDKDKTLLENWRIHSDQTGYVKKRFIGQNIRLISGITEHCQNVNLPGIALFLDFKKAFDGIEWDFLIKALETFGFGNLLVKWIKTVHTKPESCVTDNGFANTLFFHWNAELNRGAPFPEFCLLLPSSF